ncbi:MAG: GGDEF domain-containing protein [Candidatus Omnitrophica bacterium]|nr:GGDEF domain-containing protein [Candidatus Omnitrophota bacterium]
MLTWAIVTFIFSVLVVGHILFLRRFKERRSIKDEQLTGRHHLMKKKNESLTKEIDTFDSKINEQFFFYELIRKIDPILDERELFNVFIEEIKRHGRVDKIEISDSTNEDGSLEFKLHQKSKGVLRVKADSREIIECLPSFAGILDLCLDRIKLYERLSRLSIYDSLTQAYNRRYFNIRYDEEFKRAKRYKLNLSFLMIDIDHFKKINDTYGHLAGDVVLKAVASFVKDSIREIDFIGRLGGEEFGVVLSDTDRAGAILAAERISSKISSKRIRAFDEIVATTVSVGVGSYPANTLYPDVLIEVADKALYKAKVSGRNQASWF